MRWVCAALVATAIALSVGGQAAGGSATSPSLRVMNLQPLTLQGQRFVARERVRVDIWGATRATRRLVVSRSGAFVARFSGVSATRCDVIRAVAIGGSGSRATLKLLPAPACQID